MKRGRKRKKGDKGAALETKQELEVKSVSGLVAEADKSKEEESSEQEESESEPASAGLAALLPPRDLRCEARTAGIVCLY